MASVGGSLGRGWARVAQCCASPTTGASAALLRVGVGLVAVRSAVDDLVNLERFFANSGMLPWDRIDERSSSAWTLVALAPESDVWLYTLTTLQLVVAVTLVIGVLPRCSAALAWGLHLSFAWRNPYVQNGGELVLGVLLLLLVFAPIDRRLVVYVPAWRRRQHAWWPATRLPLRVVALQITCIYVATGWHKLVADAWAHGFAMRLVLRDEAFARYPIDIDHPALSIATWGTLAFEVLFPLVFVPRLRRWFLAVGVLFHAGIEALLLIPTFSWIMVASYASFVPDAVSQRWIDRVRATLYALRRHVSRIRHATTPPEAPVIAETTHVAATSPNASATMPASNAPAA